MSDSLTIGPYSRFSGEMTLPGSKSLSNRALLLAALCPEPTRLSGLLASEDTFHMQEALKALQVSWQEQGSEVIIQGGGEFAVPEGELFLGNAGTAMRPLCAALALRAQGRYVLTGEPRMEERPIGPLVSALRMLGANISYLKKDGFPPLLIEPPRLPSSPLTVTMDASLSSQFVSAFLLAAPLLDQTVTLELEGELVSLPYIEITVGMMKVFGVQVEREGERRLTIRGDALYRSPGHYLIEGDASSASYFLAAGVLGGGPMRVKGVGKASIQGDVQFCEVLEEVGGRIFYEDHAICAESGSFLKGVNLDLNAIPDAAMTLATMALFLEGPTTIRNIYNWRIKETDRLAAMANELVKVGALVEQGADFITIHPPDQVASATIQTYQDHRMAMCFALAAFGAPMTILDPGCTRKTFPDFFREFTQRAR